RGHPDVAARPDGADAKPDDADESAAQDDAPRGSVSGLVADLAPDDAITGGNDAADSPDSDPKD
ncbi:hypothetical protein, partial [Blastomonas sp.]|uniref:hypothetical protein n=1 Tax=Blastomonas sp. TaxID=1909299 RepID=UPI0035931B10